MLDLPEPVFDQPAGPAPERPRPARPTVVSPLRAWSMWGGWSAIGVVCAVSLTRAAWRVGRAWGARGTVAARAPRPASGMSSDRRFSVP